MVGDSGSVIRNVFVVGFHHKKGCQVEYCYPPLDGCSQQATQISDDDLPKEWRHLSSLALPDGAHNCEKDTVFFHLPCNQNPNQTLYGVSCYRQISAHKLTNKTTDVTRSTVQKSVCVISSLPLYGLLHTKLELITQAYFEQCDFEKVELLADMYNYMKSSINETDSYEGQQLFGLSVRELALDYGHRIVLLFKLLLLEKRVLFYMFPVHRLCRTILSLLSLFPNQIEKGLVHCLQCCEKEEPLLNSCVDVTKLLKSGKSAQETDDSLLREIEEALNEKLVSDCNDSDSKNRSTETKDEFGFPLDLFHKGSICQPYLSLAYLDWLRSPAIRSYVVGATNALFKQRRSSFDVLVTFDDEGPKIEFLDAELKRQLTLSTADLRFADFLLKVVNQRALVDDDPLHNSEWEGGDDWIRLQFRSYLLSLMATVRLKDSNKFADFNESFVEAWLHTYNFKSWVSADFSGMSNVLAGHTFNGQLSVADMKLRFSHTMQSSEQGRKLNQAVAQTGKYVQQTSKAVGSAVRSAMNQWWWTAGSKN